MTSNSTLRRIEKLALELADLLEENYKIQYNEVPTELIDELSDIAYAAYMEVEYNLQNVE